jgi:hypothetical protein
VPEHLAVRGAASSSRHRTAIIALFTALAAVMTWPQVLVLASHAEGHQDVYFNLWRLRWTAHALVTSPIELFDANQFHPERGVLAYSDAMLFEGIIAAPLFWVGLPPVLVHNLVLLGAIVASGVSMFTLARHVTGSTGAAITAGIVFAFAPYRFDHYMHMELQWTMWTPLAFWALQRTLESGSVRCGAMTGAFVALQMASSVYYGIFLSVLIAIVGAVQLVPLRGRLLLAAVRSLVVGAGIALAFSAAYSKPYTAASGRVGTRHSAEVEMFSARARDYRAATPTNRLYGAASSRGMPERRLFPGLLPPLLALAGLLLVLPRSVSVAYVIGLAAAIELSLGLNGRLYPWLYEHVPVFTGLRAPARAAMFSLMFVAVLAGQGLAALMSSIGRAPARVAAFAAAGILLTEYAVRPMELQPYDNEPPPVYSFLSGLPRGVVAEFPMPRSDSLPGPEPLYLYMSTFHWKPLLNGYSGYYPPRYLRRLDTLETFPDPQSLDALRTEDVRYIVVHAVQYRPAEYRRIVEELVQLGLAHLGTFSDARGDAAVFQL